MPTQASTADSNETLMKILISETPLTSTESQTEDHPVAYISDDIADGLQLQMIASVYLCQ